MRRQERAGANRRGELEMLGALADGRVEERERCDLVEVEEAENQGHHQDRADDDVVRASGIRRCARVAGRSFGRGPHLPGIGTPRRRLDATPRLPLLHAPPPACASRRTRSDRPSPPAPERTSASVRGSPARYSSQRRVGPQLEQHLDPPLSAAARPASSGLHALGHLGVELVGRHDVVHERRAPARGRRRSARRSASARARRGRRGGG